MTDIPPAQALPSGANRGAPLEQPSRYWFARHSKSILFVVVVLAIVGVYEAFSIPIAVFPSTNFPRIIIGVDNGVMPIDQMEVTITRPIEEAVNSVPGLEDVRSTTSRGSAEVDLFFNWNVDMAQTLLLVNSAVARVQRNSARDRTNRNSPPGFCELSDFGLQLDVRQSSADAAMGTGHLRVEAAPEPLEWRRNSGRPRRPGTGIPDRSRHGANAALARDASGCSRCGQSHELDRLARLAHAQSPAVSGARDGAGENAGRNRRHRDQERELQSPFACGILGPS